jgi:hypothetical protein
MERTEEGEGGKDYLMGAWEREKPRAVNKGKVEGKEENMHLLVETGSERVRVKGRCEERACCRDDRVLD